MAVQYSDLVIKTVNGNKTVFNTKTGQGYSTPQQLAADLGVSNVDWGKITTNENYNPSGGLSVSSSPSTNYSIGSVGGAQLTQTISSVGTAQPTQSISVASSPTAQTASTPTATAPTTAKTTGTSKVSYADLINKNGTIYNAKTGQGYPTPESLAADLGISTSSIQWNQIQSNPNYTPSGSASQATSTASTTAPAGIDQNLWKQLSPADQAFANSMNTLAQQQYQQGQVNMSINAENMQKALELAQNDPIIQATYGDQAKMALANLQQNLGYINAEYAQQMGLTTAQQAQAMKDLQSQQAAAGLAQSGFRQQAQGLLKQQQQAVIQSSQRQMQQQLQQMGSQYESQFGSSGMPSVSAGGFSYSPVGGITGSQALGKQQAVQQQQLYNYQTIANPLTK